MIYSEKVQFCLANVSRNDRMASLIQDPGLKASYAESANQWRRLAEKIKQLEKECSAQPERSAITRNVDAKSDNSISEVAGAAVSQVAQSRDDDAHPDNAVDYQEQRTPCDNAEHPNADGKQDVENLSVRRGDAESQATQTSNLAGQIDARRDPLTGQWGMPPSLSGGSTERSATVDVPELDAAIG